MWTKCQKVQASAFCNCFTCRRFELHSNQSDSCTFEKPNWRCCASSTFAQIHINRHLLLASLRRDSSCPTHWNSLEDLWSTDRPELIFLYVVIDCDIKPFWVTFGWTWGAELVVPLRWLWECNRNTIAIQCWYVLRRHRFMHHGRIPMHNVCFKIINTCTNHTKNNSNEIHKSQ